MNIFELTLLIKGFNINEGYQRIKEIQKIPDEIFLNWQEDRKREILSYHYQNNARFRDKCSGKLPEKWTDVPVMTKKDLQFDLKDILSTGIESAHLYISNTSGSSGHPFFFAKNKKCHSLTWGIIKERYERHGIRLGDRQARFYGIPLTFRENIKERIKDFLANRKRFPVFDLSDPILEKFLERFRSDKFRYIYGYTSAIVLFAKFLIKRNIKLKSVCPTLRACIVTSEICTDEDKILMKIAFDCEIINEYGASELDFIAIEDEGGDWILTEESLFVEILDENGKQVENGTEGRIVITSLFNKAMPFIRYDIGDIGMIAKGRKGKYRILKSLTGRSNDFALLPSGKKSAGLTFYYVSKSLLEANGVMKEFIIKQESQDTFLYEYVAERELNEKEIQCVNEMMDTYLEPGLKIRFEKKEIIQRSKAGKLKHFHSLLKP